MSECLGVLVLRVDGVANVPRATPRGGVIAARSGRALMTLDMALGPSAAASSLGAVLGVHERSWIRSRRATACCST